MSVFRNFFGRQYETVASIKDLKLKEILNIQPDQISTNKIISDNEFKKLPPLFQEAVKYIRTRKNLMRTYNFPPYENIEIDFIRDKLPNREVNQLVDETALEIDLRNQQEAFELAQMEKRRQALHEGGKKRSRKQRKQRRRKTRRSV
jgi:hypothetical protein